MNTKCRLNGGEVSAPDREGWSAGDAWSKQRAESFDRLEAAVAGVACPDHGAPSLVLIDLLDLATPEGRAIKPSVVRADPPCCPKIDPLLHAACAVE